MRYLALGSVILGLLFGATRADAQSYPSGPIRLVVPSGPGTQSDLVSRALAQRLGPVLGQPVVVDNRPGADGMLAVEAVVAAPADGLTLVNVQSGSLTIAPLLYASRIRYDVERDLAPVTLTVRATFVMTVNGATSVRSLKELVAFTKANPRTAALAHMPGAAYLGALVAKQVLAADIELVPYKAAPAIWTDLFGGRVHAGIEPVGGAYPQIKAGKLRAIALLGAARTTLLPDVPTATEQGFSGMEIDAWNALFVRAGTSSAVIERLQRESVRILEAAEVKDQLLAGGMEVLTSDPATLAKRVRDDRAKWERVIREFNVKPDN